MARAAAASWLIATSALGLGACAGHRPPESPAAEIGTVVPSGSAGFVAAAIAMVGQPYRWGGTEPGGFDCSGLVVYAARRAGLSLPRTAHEQAQSGAAVLRTAVQAGDLVFLHLARKELHVGIALDADHFVHAPSSGGSVRIDSLTARPYGTAFLQARRLRFPP